MCNLPRITPRQAIRFLAYGQTRSTLLYLAEETARHPATVADLCPDATFEEIRDEALRLAAQLCMRSADALKVG